ncbi:sensor histidine kinase [Pusillimonas sp. ANT_WB101]|uniref:sensor histidine kinase n=1 Tax=Pusillimonas sp. ANT_WB101 TaxID=2597356 RepID=UPI0011EEF3AF|nr:ATP-binding protein [Pusillimonas sp. ANT_WB101]KAA0889962.1 GHKL domain-containing protein [Pusillimonas sp. ANT_WB101]
MDIREIDLQDVCRDVLHLIVPTARHYGVAVVTNFDSRELLVCADPTLLQQAMLNLLLNALDALVGVPEARAVIELRVTSLQSGEVEILVRDHGNGVPKRYLDQLFDTYFTTKMHGLGLGLPIVRSIVESHGGRIKAENHPEGGAVFRFTIPVAHVAGPTNHQAGNHND